MKISTFLCLIQYKARFSFITSINLGRGTSALRVFICIFENESFQKKFIYKPNNEEILTQLGALSVIFLYFSKDADSTVCIIKNKQTKLQIYPGAYLHRGGHWCKSTATADAKSKSESGNSFLFCTIQKSRKKFCQDSGSGKRGGAFHSLFRKRKYMPWYHLFFIKLDYDSRIRCI